jgi:hypothetical protein
MTPIEPKKSKLLMKFVLLLLALAAIILIIVFSSYHKPKTVVNNTNDDQQTNNADQELEPIIPDWKVYESKEYGFRIDYPSDWKARGNAKDYYYPSNIVNLVSPDLLNPDDPFIADYDKEEVYYKINNFYDPSLDEFFMYNSDISLRIYSSMKDEHGANTIKDLIETNNEIRVIGKTKTGDVEATELIWGGEGDNYVIIAESNGYFYDIVLNRISGKEGLSDTLKQIISSFQFIK